MTVALAICKRCSIQYKYDALIREQVTGLWVCQECVDQPDPRQIFFTPKIDNPSLSRASPDEDIAV